MIYYGKILLKEYRHIKLNPVLMMLLESYADGLHYDRVVNSVANNYVWNSVSDSILEIVDTSIGFPIKFPLWHFLNIKISDDEYNENVN